jgi:sodium-independent sulfate anion transporter 11
VGSIAKSGNNHLSKATNIVTSGIKTKVSEMCTKEFVHRRLPFTTWLPQYNFSTLVQDMLAGLTVALTLIPQSIAYAEIAGLQPQVHISLLCSIRTAFQKYLFG